MPGGNGGKMPRKNQQVIVGSFPCINSINDIFTKDTLEFWACDLNFCGKQ